MSTAPNQITVSHGATVLLLFAATKKLAECALIPLGVLCQSSKGECWCGDPCGVTIGPIANA